MPEDPRIDVKLVRMALAYGLTTDPPSEIEFRAKWANGASVDEHLDATGCALAWAIIQTQIHKAASPKP